MADTSASIYPLMPGPRSSSCVRETLKECESIFRVIYERIRVYLRDRRLMWRTFVRNALPRCLKPPIEDFIVNSETCDWKSAPTRCIVLHPSCNAKKALLKGDESVLYYKRCTTDYAEREVPRCLQSTKMAGICCGAFRPWYEPTELAVGGDMGISIWHLPRYVDGNNPVWGQWIPCGKSDSDNEYVKELQWLNEGLHLACAVVYQQCVQIWDTDAVQLLQSIAMPQVDNYKWLLRFKPDMLQLFAMLEPTEDYEYSLSELNILLTQCMELQTAVWTNCGNHLLFAAREDARIFVTTPNTVDLFVESQKPSWFTEVVLDLSDVKCTDKFRYCSSVLALAIDPCDIFVAILFERQPYVLICELSVKRGCRTDLKPKRFIDRLSTMPVVSYPNCICFSPVAGKGEERYLFIAWSNGDQHIDSMTLRKRSVLRHLSGRMMTDLEMEMYRLRKPELVVWFHKNFVHIPSQASDEPSSE